MSAKRHRVPGITGRRTARALFVVPDADQPGLTFSERIALRVRADATITGRCACGATAPPARVRKGQIIVVPIAHEHDCPAVSAAVDAITRRLGDAVAYRMLVAEVEVAA